MSAVNRYIFLVQYLMIRVKNVGFIRINYHLVLFLPWSVATWHEWSGKTAVVQTAEQVQRWIQQDAFFAFSLQSL